MKHVALSTHTLLTERYASVDLHTLAFFFFFIFKGFIIKDYKDELWHVFRLLIIL